MNGAGLENFIGSRIALYVKLNYMPMIEDHDLMLKTIRDHNKEVKEKYRIQMCMGCMLVSTKDRYFCCDLDCETVVACRREDCTNINIYEVLKGKCEKCYELLKKLHKNDGCTEKRCPCRWLKCVVHTKFCSRCSDFACSLHNPLINKNDGCINCVDIDGGVIIKKQKL